MKFNKYKIYAIYFPSIISTIPLVLLIFSFENSDTIKSITGLMNSLKHIFGFLGSTVLIFLLSTVIREFGRFIEKIHYKSKLYFPSNTLMLYQNSAFSEQMKISYRTKLNADFGYNFPTIEEEASNPLKSLVLFNEASKMLASEFQGDEQILEANISYGFVRNLIGGLFISVPTSFIGFLIGYSNKQPFLMYASLTMVFVFCIILFCNKLWLNNNSKRYAEKLFSKYLAR